MANNRHHSTVPSTPKQKKTPSMSAPTTPRIFIPNYPLPQKSHASTSKKHFFFSTSNIRFWTTGRAGKKRRSGEKLSNSAADIVNHGDQLRYVKEERNTLRRRLYECSLRNSTRSLQLMRTSCTSEQQEERRLRQPEVRDVTVQLRHMSEPNVNVLSSGAAQERSLQYLLRRNEKDSFMHQRNGTVDGGDSDNDNDKRGRNSSEEWNEWMRNQPISVLRLDRTERLVLKIGG
ncbi:unnamed protein product [Litomosoides sigmodontis]|uniref:Uncharacterized protein n=1 Tax=Litomosoides sigmodontis TaxID=42156 RepID=A0A3P6SUE7_LITSI|nr:unnamed protein product [Litomosoides sigmodontis]